MKDKVFSPGKVVLDKKRLIAYVRAILVPLLLFGGIADFLDSNFSVEIGYIFYLAAFIVYFPGLLNTNPLIVFYDNHMKIQIYRGPV